MLVEFHAVRFVEPRHMAGELDVASCIPRQMPRNGMRFSRAYRMALIFPSMRGPKRGDQNAVGALDQGLATVFSTFSEST